MFYIKDKENIVLFDDNRRKLEQTLAFMPQYADLPILETEENETVVDYKLITIDEAKQQYLEQVKRSKLEEALAKAYEYERQTGVVTFDGRVVGNEDSQVLSIELFNQSKFFQLMIGYAQGLLTEDFVYSTKEDKNVYINEQEAQAIYYAITEKLTKLWTVDYPHYKELINACGNINEVNDIEINY